MTFAQRTCLIALIAAATSCAAGCASAPRTVAPPEPTYEEKLAGILRLEDQRILRADEAWVPPLVMAPGARGVAAVPASSPPPDLLRWLRDSEGRVRRRAALAVGRVGLAEGVEPLAALLADPEPEVRQMAAFALGLLHDRSAAPALVGALADPSPLVQGRAAEGLGLIGEQAAAPAVAEMVARHIGQRSVLALARGGEAPEPADQDVEAVRLGLFALARLQAVEPLLSVALSADGQPRLHWWPVAYALQRVRDARLGTALLTLARAADRVTRGFAINGLGAIKEARGVPLLLPVVEGWRKDPGLAALAVRALGQIGDQRAVPALLDLVAARPADPAVLLEAVDALAALGARQARERMYDLLADPWPAMRAASLRALHRIDPDNFMLVLSGLDPDRHWTVRAATAEIVGHFAPEAASPRLRAALADPDPRVLPAVLSALARSKAPGLERILVDHLRHADAVVRMSAARELASVKPPGGEAALAGAYRFGRGDTTYVARAAALDALAAYGTPPAVTSLTEALGDPEWAVRSRAASLLARIDPASDAWRRIRPATPARPSAAYAAPGLVAPRYSPHVFIETVRGTIEIELLVLEAPLTCEAFVALARDRFFDGLAVHRVVAGFVAQAGDPRGDGEGGAGRTLRDELGPTPFRRGTVGMALDWADTATSQFFITLGPQPHLDGRYPAFGRVVSGMEVVEALRQWDLITRVWVWDGAGDAG